MRSKREEIRILTGEAIVGGRCHSPRENVVGKYQFSKQTVLTTPRSQPRFWELHGDVRCLTNLEVANELDKTVMIYHRFTRNRIKYFYANCP